MAQFVVWRSKMKKRRRRKRALFVFMNWIQWSPDDFPHFYVVFVAFHDMIICGRCCCSNVLKQSAMADSGRQLINDYKISVCESERASECKCVLCIDLHARSQRKIWIIRVTFSRSKRDDEDSDDEKNMAEYTDTHAQIHAKRNSMRTKIPIPFFLPFLPANYEIVIKIQNKIETNLNVVINVYVGIFHFRWWRWQRHVCFGFVFCSHSCLAIIL